MTIPQYLALAAYWRKYPPTHLLIGNLLGYKLHETTTESLAGLLATAGKEGIFGTR
jgi:hypothetical protein